MVPKIRLATVADTRTIFYMKHGAVELAPGSPWAVRHDLAGLAARLPRPDGELMTGLR